MSSSQPLGLKLANRCMQALFAAPLVPLHHVNVVSRGNPLTCGYENLLAKMHEFGVFRLVLLSTVSVAAPQDHFALVREGLVNGIKLIGNTAWTDVVATGELIRSGAGKGLQITLARVPTLTNGEGGSLHVGYIGETNQTWTLTRFDLANFFVSEAESPKWANEAPLLSSSYSYALCCAPRAHEANKGPRND